MGLRSLKHSSIDHLPVRIGNYPIARDRLVETFLIHDKSTVQLKIALQVHRDGVDEARLLHNDGRCFKPWVSDGTTELLLQIAEPEWNVRRVCDCLNWAATKLGRSKLDFVEKLLARDNDKRLLAVCRFDCALE